jgi:proteasome lid subunit RPN8/RPN11
MRAIASKLKRKLKADDTIERCGLVLADGSCPEKKNIHAVPEKGFMFRAQDLIENEEQLVGSWHTHPGQTAALSHEDYTGFSQWPQLVHYIIGTDGVRAYRTVDGVIQEVDLAAD